MSNTFIFLTGKNRNVEAERTLNFSQLKFCENDKCGKFIDPNKDENGFYRIMPIGRYNQRKYCGKSCACSQRNRNVEYKQEWKDKQSATLIKRHETLGTYYIPKDQKLSYSQYKKRVYSRSKRTLKRLDRKLYNNYQRNAWSKDNTDPNALTIEHKIQVRQCYDCGISIKQASNINNLEIITMKENWDKRK